MSLPTTPLANDYVVICDLYKHFSVEEGWFKKSDAPSLLRTRDGTLLCAVPMFFVGGPDGRVHPLWFYRSEDDGKTWSKLPGESDFCCGTLFEHDGSLYFLGTGPDEKQNRCEGIRIIRSEDNGLTWTEPVDLVRGGYYQPAAGYVMRDNRIYWCCCDSSWKTTYALAGDLTADLTDPASWRMSEGVTDPGVPPTFTIGAGHSRTLEGNVIEVEGKLRVAWRYQFDRRATAHIAAICELEDDGKTLKYRFQQFYPWPGGFNQFHVIRDPVTGLYWMTSNLPTHTQTESLKEWFLAHPRLKDNQGNERRILALSMSFDALNWLPAGYVTIWPLPRQSSNYCGLLIDGEDLLVAARSSRDGRNEHDNDLVTFHRVRDFRALAGPLIPAKMDATGKMIG